MKNLYFPYPFSWFTGINLINNFTALYMYLEKMTGNNDYDCVTRDGKSCNGCGNCKGSLGDKQGCLFFLFDTISGRSATVWDWEFKPTPIYQEIVDTDSTVDFLFGYTGYGYEKYTEKLADKIRISIDKDIPVLARIKNPNPDCDTFRIITGYDGTVLLQARPPEGKSATEDEPSLDEIDSVYIVTGKIERKYTLLDGLKRIKRVMDADREAKIWDKYINAFNNYWGELANADLEEIKKRFEYASKAMWWNCHNFAEVFRIYKNNDRNPNAYENEIWNEWKDNRFASACKKIDVAYDDSHKRQWQVQALSGTRDWSKRFYNEWEWGMCECAVETLRVIKHDDEIVYGSICELIEIMESLC